MATSLVSGKMYFFNIGRHRPPLSEHPSCWAQKASDKDGKKDRISALPDEIVHHILSFLPMSCAVQIGILSSRWKHLWKFNAVLDFDWLPFNFDDPADYGSIEKCIDLHLAPRLRRFSVISHVGSSSSPNTKKWVDFAMKRGVESITVGLMAFPFPYTVLELPCSFYTNGCKSLVDVLLSCIDFNPPTTFVGFASLTRLRLYNCKLSDDTVHLIVSKCLLLETLVLDNCLGLVKVKISGSNLRMKQLFFKWEGLDDGLVLEIDVPSLESLMYNGSLNKICLKNVRCLLNAAIDNYKIEKIDIDGARRLIAKVAHLTLFSVNSWFPKFLAKEYYMGGNRCTAFKNLVVFNWYGQLRAEIDLITLVAFLADCPSLEIIKIDFRDQFWVGFCNAVFLDEEEPDFVEVEAGAHEPLVGCLFKLKTIKVLNFSGYKSEVELLKWLLQKAVILEILFVNFRVPKITDFASHLMVGYTMSSTTLRKLPQEVLQEKVSLLPRASSNAQLIFE